MPQLQHRAKLYRRLRAPAAAIALLGSGALAVGCDYQLQLQPTTTPTSVAGGTLHVKTIPGQPTPAAEDATPGPSAIDQAVARYLNSSAAQPAAAPALSAAAAQPQAQLAPAAPAADNAPAPAPAAAGPAAAAVAVAPAQRQVDTAAVPSYSVPPVAARDTTFAAAPIPTASSSATPSASPTPPVTRTASFRAAATPTPASTPAPSPAPAPTASPIPPPTVSPTQAPPPTAAPKPVPQPVTVYLHDGSNDFQYVGATVPVNQALAHLAGMYDAAYFQAPGSGQVSVYRPGIDGPTFIPTGSSLRINMKPNNTAMFAMYPPN